MKHQAPGSADAALRNFLKCRISRAGNLTANEQKIAEFYMGDPSQAVLAKLQQVSEQTGVSPASVTRFSAKLGFDSFRRLRESLLDVLAQESRKPVNTIGHGDVSSIHAFAGHLQREINRSLIALDVATVQRIAENLADTTHRVYLAAMFTGRPLMQYFGDLLSYVRADVEVLAEPDRWAYQISSMAPGDVVLLAMMNRVPSQLVGLAHFAKRRGATVIVISNHGIWEEHLTADFDLAFDVHNSGYSFTSRIPLIAIYELLLECVSVRVGENQTQTLRKSNARSIEEAFEILQTHSQTK
ncbi:MurR/RpiR family transcriptional regulator [Rothia terrae]|uniref:MurR/RpiR family transcriptional regulator n=1 Tax=Rothia terrae TaxID=396015 RepID=UPI0033CB15D1